MKACRRFLHAQAAPTLLRGTEIRHQTARNA